MEKIARLEYDLESAREEIVEMQQKGKNDDDDDGFMAFGSAFPTSNTGPEDFFSEDEEEEHDFWGV